MEVYGYDRDEFGMRADQYLVRVAACTAEGYLAADPPKRPQRGGIEKGRSFTREAAVLVVVARVWRRNWPGARVRMIRPLLVSALRIIHAHARKPATRAEALRLLTVLETRG
jgi:hypothetical protein